MPETKGRTLEEIEAGAGADADAPLTRGPEEKLEVEPEAGRALR